MPDWEAIAADHAAGLSIRTLAAKYGISKSHIHEKLSKGHTDGQSGQEKHAQNIQQLRTPPALSSNRQTVEPSSLPEKKKDDPALLTVKIARAALQQIAQKFIDGGLDEKQLKLLMDSLSQANKILIAAPAEQEEIAPYDLRLLLRECTAEELEVIRPVIAAVQQRKNEAEEKVKPIRRIR